MVTFQYNNGNESYLKIKGVRHTAVGDWTGASTRIQQIIDVTNQAYIDFNPVGGTYGLAFGTGGPPSEAMRINSSQQVGIGRTNPTYTLDVLASSIRIGNGASFLIDLGTSGVGTTRSAYLNGDGTNVSLLNQQNGALFFGTNNAEVLRINSSGNVGIGTITPSEKLSVHNGGQDRVGLGVSGAVSTLYLGSKTSTEAYRTLEFSRSTGNLDLYYGSVGSALTSALTVDSSGKIGIGTTGPTQKLEVYGATSSSTLAARVNNAGTGETTKARLTLSTALADWHLDSNRTNSGTFSISDGTDVRMTIDASGNVGVGATPSHKLHVLGSTSITTPTVLVKESQAMANATATVDVQNSAGTSLFFISGSGNVGIGTASPQALLHISGSLSSTALLRLGGNAATTSHTTFYQENTNAILVMSGSVTGGSYSGFVHRRAGTDYFSFDVKPGTSGADCQLSVGDVQNDNGYQIDGYAQKIYYRPENAWSNGTSDYYPKDTWSVNYNNASDYRLKSNVNQISGSLSKVLNLNPVTYNFISDGKLSAGFIAHEVQQHLPTVVDGEKDAVNEDGRPKVQGIKYNNMIPYLVDSIKELNSMIVSLQGELISTKSEVELLKEQIASILTTTSDK
jgi:hypothetical protein